MIVNKYIRQVVEESGKREITSNMIREGEEREIGARKDYWKSLLPQICDTEYLGSLRQVQGLSGYYGGYEQSLFGSIFGGTGSYCPRCGYRLQRRENGCI